MKRGAIPFVLFLAVLAPRARAWDPPAEPVTIEEAVFVEMDDWREPPQDRAPDRHWLPEGPAAAAEKLVRRIRQSPFRVHATAYRFRRLPAALEGVGTRTSAVLGPVEAATIGAHVREGSLVLLHAVRASGPAEADLLARDLERRNAVLRRQIESSIGAVVSFPRVSFLRGGLRLRARVGLRAAVQGVTVRYQVTLADAPVRETRPSLGGSLDTVSVPALLAQGTVRLVPGEAAAILRVEEDGSGRLVLLSVTGRRPDVGAVTDLGNGYVAVLAGHLSATEARPAARLLGVDGYGGEAEDGAPFVDAWDAFAEAAGVGEESWERGPCGMRFGAVAPAARGNLELLLTAGAVLRGTRSRIDVARKGWGRLSLPASPGTAFRFFSGTVGTGRGGTEVESGCNHCVLAVPKTAWACRGLKGAGWACVDGTVDFDVVGREVLDVERRTYELRRIQDGYRGYARDPFEVPLVRERILACRGALPTGEERLPGGVRLRFHVDPPLTETGRTAVHVGNREIEGALPVGGGGCLLKEASAAASSAGSAPVRLRISGEPVPVRPGVESWFELQTHYPFVRRWTSEGWCGMRARYPVPGRAEGGEYGIREGSSLALRARRADGVLLLDIRGEIRGAPEDLGPFDPGDGPVRILRSPRLRIDIRAFPLGGGGRLAHGAGLALVIDREDVDVEPGPHLQVAFRSESAGTSGFLSGQGAGGLLDAGADWLLPTDFTICTSSHATGQVSTAFTTGKDGIVLRIEPTRREHARVDVRIRSRPSFEPYRLKVDVEPDRPENELTLLCLRRRATGRVLYLDHEDRLEYRSPDLSLPYEVSARIVSAGGGK